MGLCVVGVGASGCVCVLVMKWVGESVRVCGRVGVRLLLLCVCVMVCTHACVHACLCGCVVV